MLDEPETTSANSGMLRVDDIQHADYRTIHICSRSGLGLLAAVLALACAAWLYPANPKGFLIVFVALICAGGIGAFLLGEWFKSAGTSA
jgi:hypothetical protein